MALAKEIKEKYDIKDVKRIQYFDTRYYKVLYQVVKKLVEVWMVSVTEILQVYPKPFLARWRGDVGNERADQIQAEAMKLGSFIHYGAEVLAKGGAIIYNPPGNPMYSEVEIAKLIKQHGSICVCNYQAEYVQLYRIWQFFQEVKPTEIETEQTVFSIEYGYAGTLDLLIKIKEGTYMIAGSTPLYLEGGYYVCDYKTGKAVGFTYKMQLAAYMNAIMENIPRFKKELKGGLILHPANEQIKNGIEGFKATLITRQESETLFDAFLKTFAVYKIENPIPKPKDEMMPALLVLPSKKSKKR